jgi:hypothetical protein
MAARPVGSFRFCAGCVHDDLDGSFSIQGTGTLTPGSVYDDEVAGLLRDGWSLTLHEHAPTAAF